MLDDPYFLSAIKHTSRLSDQSLNEILGICKTKKIKKNEYVLPHLAVCEGFYFVSKGLLRIYYYKQEKEISEWFAFEHTFCFSILSFFNQTPSSLIIQCIEDSEIIIMSKTGLDVLRNVNFEIANFAYQMISRSLIFSQIRVASLQFETAQQRYESLFRDHKNMIQRIPLQYIASYLGVSAETLSRIRAQIH